MQENSKDEFLKIARQYLLENIGDDVDVVQESVEDFEDLFYFSYQSKEFLNTKNFEDKLIGQGPIFIIKKDGRIVSYGSAFGSREARIDVINKLNKERLIRIFQEDYDIWETDYDLVINKIYERDKERIISMLLKYKTQYTLTNQNKETSYHFFNKDQLQKKFKKLPLNLGKLFNDSLDNVLVELINNYPYCEFTLLQESK
ncbi:YrhB domain-containing protein [Chryseobacterium luquanense]|uniref:YrhB family protein n=1 Tax=Chryseobacterium luquanense TaxID=2983766 RepID=A0ABT3Y0E6_9FLAO|nr:YrhB domain-containing protein [Chryseobacterium luquanense]MCX8531607.1 YrhB family protein [Chryseobacterium luquanense]